MIILYDRDNTNMDSQLELIKMFLNKIIAFNNKVFLSSKLVILALESFNYTNSEGSIFMDVLHSSLKVLIVD